MPPIRAVLDRLFQLTARGTTAGREVRGAFATFLTMAYILFANPAILAACGMPTVQALAAGSAAALPPVTFGTLRDPQTAIALAGLLLIAALMARKVNGAILFGIAASTALALATKVARLPEGSWFSAPRFETFGKADLRGALSLRMLPLFLAVLLLDCTRPWWACSSPWPCSRRPSPGSSRPPPPRPALVAVGFLMFQQIARIDFRALPTFVLLITIPLTYSISHGIGYGFVAYVAVQLLLGRARDVDPLMYVAAAAFASYFLLVS